MYKTQKHRNITFYKNYFQDFFAKQSKKVKAKIVWTFNLVEELQTVPETYLKHIENTEGLYEIRIQQVKDIFRIFCFFRQRSTRDYYERFPKENKQNTKKRN